MKSETVVKKKKAFVVKKRAKNLNTILNKTFTVTREVDEISKCVRHTLPKNKSTGLLVDMLVEMRKHTKGVKKNLTSRAFVIPNIENIGNANLLKILTLNGKKSKKNLLKILTLNGKKSKKKVK